MQKTQKTFSCRRKFHPTPGTLSNQLSVTWENRRENWNLPGPVNYATQNGRPCPRTGIFFCKATSAEDRNLQPPKALNKDRTPPKHALARAVEYTALGTGVRAEARPIAHFLENRFINQKDMSMLVESLRFRVWSDDLCNLTYKFLISELILKKKESIANVLEEFMYVYFSL